MPVMDKEVGLNSDPLDLVLNEQQSFFEPQMLDEIPIILIASKEQQEAEQDYYQNALGSGNAYLFC